nr:sulfotransferase family 2 domain-containing protein [Elusimicrobiota bacterium]
MIVFVHNNKTAGTTLKFILRNSFGIHHCDSAKSKTKPFLQKDLRFAKKVFFGINSIAGHNLVEPTKHLTDPDLDFITILRDPVKRCASHYQDKVARGRINEPFESWIKNKRFRNVMVNRIAGGPDPDKAYELLKNRYLLVGLTEKFNEFLRMLGIVSPYKINIKYKKKLVNSDNSVKRKILSDKKNLKVLKEGNELDIILY